jgi:hypothetical protein
VVRGDTGGCPDKAQVETQLAPLVPEHDLVDEDAAQGVLVEVRDLGDAYSVTVHGRERVLEEPSRDCLERARAAAVIAALSLRDTPASEPGAAEAVSQTPDEDAREARWALLAFGQAQGTPGRLPVVGGGAGASLSFGPWVLALRGGLLAPAHFESEAEELRGAGFRVQRIPVALTGGSSWDLGAVRWGARIGPVLDLMRVHGAGVPSAAGGLRLNPGVAVGVDLLWPLRGAWDFYAGAEGSLYPRTYEAWVEPDVRLGSTPRGWIGGSLGLQYTLRGKGPSH